MIVLNIIQEWGYHVRTQDGIVLFPFNFRYSFRFNFGELILKSNKVSQNILERKMTLMIKK